MRISPNFVDKIVKIGLNFRAFFTVGILIAIVAVIFFKGSPYLNLELSFHHPKIWGGMAAFSQRL